MRMKISLVIPVWKESSRIERAWSDLVAFFQRLPVEIEVLFVVDPEKGHKTISSLQALSAPSSIQIKILSNDRHQGRAQSALIGLRAAQGDLTISSSIDFSVPLGDILTLVYELLATESLDMIVAQRRNAAKKNRRGQKNRWSKLYEEICTEKFSQRVAREFPAQSFSDPCSPVMIYRTSKVQPELQRISTRRSWFLTPALLYLALDKKWTVKEIPVNAQDSNDSRFRFWMLFS